MKERKLKLRKQRQPRRNHLNKYKSKSVTLRTNTHSLLSDLSKQIVPGYDLSIPNTIDYIAKEYLGNENVSGSKGTVEKDTNELHSRRSR